MASSNGADTAAKQRIISHMNADHQDCIIRYAEHYCNISTFSASDARIHDVSFDHLGITVNGKQRSIPIDPPLKSWREARERLIQMDNAAASALSRSTIAVREYRRPKGFHAVVFTVCFLTFATFCRRQNILPGSYLYEGVLKYVPSFANFMATVQPFVFYGMLVIHVTEVYFMHKRRLQKHTVVPLSRVWWLWTLSTFIEGVGAFQRFDALVKEKQAAKDAQKH